MPGRCTHMVEFILSGAQLACLKAAVTIGSAESAVLGRAMSFGSKLFSPEPFAVHARPRSQTGGPQVPRRLTRRCRSHRLTATRWYGGGVPLPVEIQSAQFSGSRDHSSKARSVPRA